MNAIAYLRVSGKSQVEGDGFTRQQETIDRTAEKNDFTIVRTFKEEGVSGITECEDRPAFMEMVSFILANPGTPMILVENLTRVARHVRVQENLMVYLASKNIDLISCDTGENITAAIREDPMREALIQMQAVFSQLEKKNLVLKLRAARERKKAETGRCGGQHPFGALPGEKAALDSMFRLRDEGDTVRVIADKLNFDGWTTRNGRPWTFGVVAKILSRHLQNEPEFQ